MKSVLTIILTLWCTFLIAQEKKYPFIKHFGGIYEIEGASEFPDSKMLYKIIVDLKTGEENKEGLNDGLNNVARMINLHGLGGVPKENLNIIVVIHGPATATLLKNEFYLKKSGVNNGNIDILNELIDFGVKFKVCGQSMLGRGFTSQQLNPNVVVSISALTAITTYQLQNYALITF